MTMGDRQVTMFNQKKIWCCKQGMWWLCDVSTAVWRLWLWVVTRRGQADLHLGGSFVVAVPMGKPQSS